MLDESNGEAKLKDLTVDEVQKKAVVSTEHYPKDKDGGVVEFVFTLWMTQDGMKINHVKQFIDTEGVRILFEAQPSVEAHVKAQ